MPHIRSDHLTAGHDGAPLTPPKRTLRRFLPLAILAALAIIALASGFHRYLMLDALVHHREALDALIRDYPVIAVLAYLAVYIAITALGLPGALLLTAIGGLLFGTWLGGTLTVIGATIGATTIFLIARSAVGSHLAERAGPLAARLTGNFCDNAFNYLLFLRLVPAFPFFLVNLVPALCNVRTRTYVAATALGIIPGTFVIANVGAGLDSVIAAQAANVRACLASGNADCHVVFNLSSALTPQLLIALIALGLLSLAPVIVRRVITRDTASEPQATKPQEAMPKDKADDSTI